MSHIHYAEASHGCHQQASPQPPSRCQLDRNCDQQTWTATDIVDH